MRPSKPAQKIKSEEPKTRKRKNTSRIFIITIVLLVLAGVGGAFFAYRLGFKNGEVSGFKARSNELDANLSEVSNLLQEKLDLQEKSDELFSSAPDSLNLESIDIYINIIDSLEKSTTDDSAKKSLADLVEALNSFRSTYETENNDKIAEKFEDLKTRFAAIEEALNGVYNSRIKSAVEKL